MNLIQPILNYAKTRPDAPALVDGEHEIRYGELAWLILRTAAHLAALGIAPGDRVGLCLKDSGEHVVALLAVARMGAVIVPLNGRAARAETAGLAAALSVKLALVESESAPALDCTVVPVDARWHRSVAEREPLSALPDDWHAPLDVAATSGSTGAPKLSLATHLQNYCGAAGWTELMAISGRHRYLSTLPLYFAGGRRALFLHLLRGDCVLLYGSLVNGPDFIEAAARLRATVAIVVPSLVRDLLAAAGDMPVLPGLAMLISGGAPLFAEEKRAARQKLSPNFCEGYGTSETNTISLLRSADIAAHGDSVGQPHSLVEIQVVDEDDQSLAVGEVGQLRLRGPSLASPLAAPGHPIHPGFRHGWYYPGEIGALDDQGYIYLTGRASELIIRHGAKIYPAEVEAVLQQHPGVLECAVIGRHAANNEEEMIAFLVGRRTLDLAAIVAHCRTHLTAAKRPQHIHVVDSLPKNTSGKIDKLALARLPAGSA